MVFIPIWNFLDTFYQTAGIKHKYNQLVVWSTVMPEDRRDDEEQIGVRVPRTVTLRELILAIAAISTITVGGLMIEKDVKSLASDVTAVTKTMEKVAVEIREIRKLIDTEIDDIDDRLNEMDRRNDGTDRVTVGVQGNQGDLRQGAG